MKKTLLTFAALATVSLGAQAQTRMTLHEEFTGENCGPCAATNPSFWALCDTPANLTKLIHISYMAPIPSAGWFYAQDAADEGVRETYYTVPFAPYGRYDGAVPDPGCSGGSSAGHPGCFTQADIDAEYAIASPFTISVTNAWSTNFDSVIATVTVHCVGAYSGTGSVYLRSAFVQTVDFASPPGSNGESHFENVVRKMYPDATGTTMPTTYATGWTMTYTVSGPVPSYVDKSTHPYMVCWIQSDGDKKIHQAAKGTPLPGIANDAAAVTTTGPSGLNCATSASYSATHSITIKNAGTATMTSCQIYTSVDGGAYGAPFAWTGSLAPGATSSVISLAAVSVSGSTASRHTIIDSVAMPNGAADENVSNNLSGVRFFVENFTPATMPYTNTFETAPEQTATYFIDRNNNGANWAMVGGTAAADTFAYGGTGVCIYHDNYQYPQGDANIATLPVVATANPSTLEFYEAHAQYVNTPAGLTYNDSLQIVYSTDCGSTWNVIWTLADPALATVAADTNLYIASGAHDYKKKSVSLNSVPAGAMIGIQGVSDFGNNLFIDNINVRAGVTAVANVSMEDMNAQVYPNPTNGDATLSFNLSDATEMNITLIDMMGRVVSNVADTKLDAGTHTYSISTNNLAAGIYTVMMHTNAGATTVRLTVAK